MCQINLCWIIYKQKCHMLNYLDAELLTAELTAWNYNWSCVGNIERLCNILCNLQYRPHTVQSLAQTKILYNNIDCVGATAKILCNPYCAIILNVYWDLYGCILLCLTLWPPMPFYGHSFSCTNNIVYLKMWTIFSFINIKRKRYILCV